MAKSAAAEEKEQKQYRAILEDLLKQPENKFCADCHSAAPRWASSKLGIFICMKCSGIHRSLGVHISFVRSVTLDKWKPHELEMMQTVGNARAAAAYEAALPRDFPRPNGSDQHALERFIRLKYEQKRFYREPQAGQAASPAAAPQAPAAQQPSANTFFGFDNPPAQPQQRTAPQAQAPVADLLGAFNSPSPAAHAPAPAPSNGGFGTFAAPPSAASKPKDDFGSFVGAPSQTAGQPGMVSSLSAALTPTAAQQKSSILSLFDTPAQPPSFVAQPGYGGQPMAYPYGQYPPQMYAASPYGYVYPGQPGYAGAVQAAYPPSGY